MRNYFGDDVFLSGKTALGLYERCAKGLPIIDYHCHLNPECIAKDEKLGDLARLWLESDHYKWRLMRICSVDERYITGDAPGEEKFKKFAEILPLAEGNPVYYFAQLELKELFGITAPLCAANAEKIYGEASAVLENYTYSSIMNKFSVKYVATTDDPADSLEYHSPARAVFPTYRPDRAFAGDKNFICELERACGFEISSLKDFKRALEKRLDYFMVKGCGFSDHSFERLPSVFAADGEAEKLFALKERGKAETEALNGNILMFLAEKYAERKIVMQLHLSPLRNVSGTGFALSGRDSGYDVMGDVLSVKPLAAFLDKLERRGALPQTLVYTLNPAAHEAVACLSGAFKGVRLGAAWWFNDSLSGIDRHLGVLEEYSALGAFPGMLTDSRSPASYVRFDFFRRILCSRIAEAVESGRYPEEHAEALIQKVCYGNAAELAGLKK